MGSLLARAEPYTLRLAAIYALLDCRDQIDETHLSAGLAVWQYAEESVKIIFGNRVGDPVADAIMEAVRRSGGMSDTEISAIFSRNVSAARLSQAKSQLKAKGLVIDETRETEGRTQRVWKSTRTN